MKKKRKFIKKKRIGFQKIVNLLDTTFDNKNLSRYVTKKWIEVYDHSEKNYNPNKKLKLKHKC